MLGALNTLSFAQDLKPTITMAVLGDSLSAAQVSNSWLGIDLKENRASIIKYLRQSGKRNKNRDKSRVGRYLENRELNWFDGQNIYSVSKQITNAKNINIETLNQAISGDKSSDLLTQLSHLTEGSQEKWNKKLPDFIWILIGANDFCAEKLSASLPPYRLRKNIEKTIQKIDQLSPTTKVILVALPKIDKLYNLSKDEIAFHSFTRDISCKQIREKANACQTLTTELSLKDQAIRRILLNEYKYALNSLSLQFAGKVFTLNDLAEFDYTKSDLAVDCFHANEKGQQRIADYLSDEFLDLINIR